MKRYPEYKPFGNYWISKIPTHWKEQKIKHLFDERVEKGYPDEPLLAATQNRGVILKSDYESRTVEATKDLHLLKLVRVGDFVISLRSFQGGIEYSYCQGIISPAYTIMIPRPEIDSSYFRHLAKSKTFIELLKGCVTGIREGQNINYALLRTYLLPLPPLEEQKAIADFLDKKSEQIDCFISLQKEAISLLKELRQAEITKAVTKGLDENAEMKDSGVEWIGDIPSEWDIKKITHIVDKTHPYAFGDGDHGIIKTEDYDNAGIPYIRVQNINWCSKLSLDNVVYISEELNKKIQKSTLRPNDVLFVKTGATIGKTGIIPENIPIANTTSHVGKITVSKDNNAKYILYALSSSVTYKQFWDIASQKTTRPELSIDESKSIRLIIPNNIDIQTDIVTYLDKKCAEIDSAIQNKEALIEKVTEYKTRLISDAVTGKIDVRGEAI